MKVISEVFSDVAKIWDYSFIGKSNHRNMIHTSISPVGRRVSGGRTGWDTFEKGTKSERRMPRLPEATKDVVSCEKVRGSANRN